MSDLKYETFHKVWFDTLKTASCRESTALIQPILPSPDTIAFHIDEITLDKVARKVCWAYDFVLEFVFYYKEHVQPFLEFFKAHWKGEWTEGDMS